MITRVLQAVASTWRRPDCSCCHPREVHRHYRSGSDCGVCGLLRCPFYTPAR